MKTLIGRIVFAITASSLIFVADKVQAAQPGPIGTYYLTDSSNSSSTSTVDAIQGNNYNQNSSYFQLQDGPIAVFSGLGVVRTMTYYTGGTGSEYKGVPSLTVIQDGTTYINGLNTDDKFFDGTTDGNANYTVGLITGDVIATNANWNGSGSVLFNTGHSDDAGITYDNLNNSLWIQNYVSGVISDYSLSGTLLSTFSTDHNLVTALAMDADHTLWFEDYGTGRIQHYATDGTYLGSSFYPDLGYALGGEIGSAGRVPSSTVPEPSSLVLLGLGGIGLATGMYRRRRTVQV